MTHSRLDTNMQAMVLAAGFGTRLWPLTAQRAKPAVPFLGKALVAHCVELLELHRISKIVVNTHYQPQSIHRALAHKDVAFSHEPDILGTAGAIRHALKHGQLAPDRSTLIINGKLFTDIDLTAAIKSHEASGAEITMILRDNVKKEAFREVICDGDVVTGFGQGRQPTSDQPLLFTGIHILSPHVLTSIPEGNSDTIRDTYPPFLERRQVFAYRDRSLYWWEFSTLQRYVDLHAQAHKVGIAPANTIAADAQVAANSQLQNCIVWARAQIGEECQLDHVVIGEDVHLQPKTHLKDTVVMRKSSLKSIERGEIRGDYVFVPLA
jgi:NDP-sugar pyrophosphorylase family protein